MSIINMLKLCSGLALFLYGMNVMSDGLIAIAGNRIKEILSRIASNKFAALLFGAVVTAIIQSSSATTVMVVGLVEAGMLTLTESAAIIMGANVGTTMTSWLFAATGTAHNNAIMKLFEPGNIVAVPALIGVILILVSNKMLYKNTGNVIIGFAILIFGMDMMTDAASPLSGNPHFMSLLTLCNNPLYGVLAGTLLTAVIQSSSASVGILQALCITGNVTYAVAIPVIMGQNIGTCVTTILASAGTSVNAKRTAMIHLYFNIIGTVIFIVVYYIARFSRLFEGLDACASASGIAYIHSVFNIASVIIMYPFTGWLVRIATKTISYN